MIDLLLWSSVFIISLIVLIKSSDVFTEVSYKIGTYFGWSDFIIGIVIFSIGTSLPELATTIIASLNQKSGVVLGNILGSNIANILFVLGLSFIFSRTQRVEKDLKDMDLPLYLIMVFILIVLSIDKTLGAIDGIFLVASFIVYILYAKKSERKVEQEKTNKKKIHHKVLIKNVFIGVVSILLVFYSSKYVIESLIKVSSLLHTNVAIISAILLALGTSFPEMMVSLHAARKGLMDVVLGNVIGSNIFNLSMILGIGSIINPVVYNKLSLFIMLPMLILSTFVALEIFETKSINIYEGLLMLLLYFAYVYMLIMFPKINL